MDRFSWDDADSISKVSATMVVTIHHYVFLREEHGVKLNAPFQRGSVWSDEQQIRWIESIWLGVPLPPIFINNCLRTPEVDYLVIDGKQRLEAIYRYLDDGLTIGGLLWSELDRPMQRGFIMIPLPCVETKFMTMAQCAALYWRLLTAGTAHTSDEVEQARQWIKEHGDTR